MFDSPLSSSAYEVLGVDPTADEETLRKAFRLRLRQTHPDTGGDAAVFVQVQRAWELVGTADARAAYDRGHGFGAQATPEWSGWRAPAPRADTRPRARSFGQPGGWRRERYLTLMREWAGTRRDARGSLRPGARALGAASPATPARGRARRGGHGARGRRPRHGLHRVARRDGVGARRRSRRQDRPHRARPERAVRRPVGGLRRTGAVPPRRARRRRRLGRADRGARRARCVYLPARPACASAGRSSCCRTTTCSTRSPSSARCAGTPVVVVSRSALSTVLRRGVTGARAVGGNEVFDVRTRLQQTVRFA